MPGESLERVLDQMHAAILVADAEIGLNSFDRELIEIFKNKNIPYLVAYNKSDLKKIKNLSDNEVSVSAETGEGIEELKNRII